MYSAAWNAKRRTVCKTQLQLQREEYESDIHGLSVSQAG